MMIMIILLWCRWLWNRHGDGDYAQTSKLHSSAVVFADRRRPLRRRTRLVGAQLLVDHLTSHVSHLPCLSAVVWSHHFQLIHPSVNLLVCPPPTIYMCMSFMSNNIVIIAEPRKIKHEFCCRAAFVKSYRHTFNQLSACLLQILLSVRVAANWASVQTFSWPICPVPLIFLPDNEISFMIFCFPGIRFTENWSLYDLSFWTQRAWQTDRQKHCVICPFYVQCFDTVGWATGRAWGL